MNRTFSLVLVWMSLLAWACTSNSSTAVIDQNKMADILFDVALAEGYVESYLMKDSLAKKDSLLQREIDKVLKIHRVDSKQFTSSYNFYRKNPSKFKELADTANNRAIRNRETIYTRRRINPS
ncbi:MAG: hypothetical protein RL131_1007 [Bacteroidota bacterium]